MNRFSMNGDGKNRTPSNRIPTTDGQTSANLNNPQDDREEQIIKALTRRDDEIESLWNEAEEDLKRFRIAHAVEHCYDRDYEGSYPIHHILWWMRHGKSWRICHEIRTAYSEFDDKQHDKSELKPIVECPLYLRLNMISEFENLRRKVIEEAENAVPKLDKAIASFRKILKA